MRFIFWNLNRLPLAEEVTLLACGQDADVVLLAEADPAGRGDVLRALNRSSPRQYHFYVSLAKHVDIYVRFATSFLKPIRDSGGITIHHLTLPLKPSVLLAVAHLPSKLHRTSEDQLLESTRIARLIRDAERLVGHDRTVLIGDLNMNPFEAGMTGADGFHAVMDRRIARRGSRIVGGERMPFFYNPMWSLLGDNSEGPPGTYYYDSGRQVNFYWNAFDQALLRPSLLDKVDVDGVEVLTEVGGLPLIDHRGVPSRSDHLPIRLSVNL